MKLINPLLELTKKHKPFKVESSVAEISPVSNKEMELCSIVTVDNKTVPVYVDFENRVCLPVRKKA